MTAMKNRKWICGLKMLNMYKPNRDLIEDSVREKLRGQEGDIVMNKKRFKPLLIAVAAVGMTFVSALTVNAATDGALSDKILKTIENVSIKINGKDVDVTGGVEKQDENGNTYYEFYVDDSSDGNASVKTYPDGKDGNAYYEFNFEKTITGSQSEDNSVDFKIDIEGNAPGESTSENATE